MFKNYFKTAWRNLIKNKTSSLINVGGLAMGMAVAVIIGLWIYDEVSFNKRFKNYDRIAKVLQNVNNNGEVQTWDNMPYPLSEELRKNYGSDFKQIAMAANWSNHIVSIDEKKIKDVGGYFEKGAPEMFSLDMIQGSRNALNDPSSVLLSASAAKAYFGNENPVGKILSIDALPVLKVAGVYKDFPENTTFAGLNFMASWDFIYANSDMKKIEDPWRPNFVSLFVQLNDNADINNVSEKIKDAKLKRVNAQLAKKKPALFLHPMSKWHLYGEFKNGKNAGGAIQYVWMFGIIGVLVLLLACINFMNLSTAQSEHRAKEVGIRKTVGSLRKQLVYQFFIESFCTVALAFTVALLLMWLSLPFFNQVSNKHLTVPWANSFFWAINILFIVFTAVVAGSYPAFYLSSFKPVKVLKGSFKAGRFAALPRKVLVVLQFSVSVMLIVGTIIVYQQINFAKSRPVGYSRSGLISIPLMNPSIHNHFNAVKEELMQTGSVVSVAEAESPTIAFYNSTSGFSWKGKDPNLSTDFNVVQGDYDYGKTIDWKIKEGRGFSRDFATDSSAIILNEAAVSFMGLKNPVGEVIEWWGKPLTVIGVVENMIVQSPYDITRPVVYPLSSNDANVVLIKINPTLSAKEALNKIEPIFKKFNTEQPFEYQFMDEEYAKKFGNEERVSKLAGFFAMLAVVISCLGLFGLTSFVAERRRKEIGVRKILGASVANVWQLLSKEFVVLVIISFFISMPLAYYFMTGWLQNYNYHTPISWLVFAIAGLGALLITLVTVSFQTIKAATTNPVKSLRTE